jgi:wyosine [tRNA(Phe)-imidazoG37] synthetase (radical SAM superfamily)
MEYLYGPVFSRRLGFSLGVDVLPKKYCPFECVYCQLGKTEKRTLTRFSYVNLERLRKELKEVIKQKSRINYITFSGSGEPTLHKELDKLISLVKRTTHYKYPVCVITNSSLLYRKEVRKELEEADLIIPSLDAADPRVFEKINRPYKSVTIDKIVSGIIALRKEFKGQIWLEIMLVKGSNDTKEEAERLAELVSYIKPDKVQLNLPLRPTAENVAIPDRKRINQISRIIGKKAKVIAPIIPDKQKLLTREISNKIMEFIARRPATVNELKDALGTTVSQLNTCLWALVKAKLIKEVQHQNRRYFTLGQSCFRKLP